MLAFQVGPRHTDGFSPYGKPVQVLIDRELFRFEEIWAAAGHPNGVFKLSPTDLPRLTGGAPVVDVPLVALETVEQAGIFGRAWDAIRLWIK